MYLKKDFVEADRLKENKIGLHNYFLRIALHLPELNRFRLLVISVLPFLKTPINKYWKGFNKILLLFPLVLTISPMVFIAYLLFLTCRFRKITPREKDILFISGSSWWRKDFNFNAIRKIKQQNKCFFVVLIHDIFPITHSNFFLESHNFKDTFKYVYEYADLLIMNSDYTMSEVKSYLQRINVERKDLKLKSFKLGFDLGLDLVKKNKEIRTGIKNIFYQSPPYISVGTIEPRKNYGFLLDTFDELWSEGQEISLCIIGRYGWKENKVVERIKSHPKYNNNLFWFDDLHDMELEYCYKNAKALIYPSLVEGFGLPLIEALSNGCNVIASDIPIFHEIGGKACVYFSLDSTKQLSENILQLETSGKLFCVIKPDKFIWYSWKESTEQLLKIILETL